MRKARGSDEVTAYLHSILRMKPADWAPLGRFRLARLDRFSQRLEETEPSAGSVSKKLRRLSTVGYQRYDEGR
jgi:hypothetical protein